MKKFIMLFIFITAIIFTFVPACASECECNGYIVKLKPSVNLCSSSNMAKSEIIKVDDLENINIPKERVEYIEPNYKVSLCGIPSDPNYNAYQWNMQMINAPYLWESGCCGQNIKIAVIDSGVNVSSDLSKNVLPGHNFIKNSTDVSDITGHGTFVSAIIAAEANNGIKIAGLANKAKIVPLKCFDDSDSDVYTICLAIESAIKDYGCKVINLSLATDSYSKTFKQSVDYAISNGAIVVSACGNDKGKVKNKYPASFPEVISVASVDRELNCFSNQNSYVDVAAPGEDVYSLDNLGRLALSGGSSFAAPIVSALAAMCLNIKPCMTSDEFDVLLSQTCIDIGNDGKDIKYGYGLVDAKAILEKLLEGKEGFIAPYDFTDTTPYTVYYNSSENDAEILSILKGDNENDIEYFELNKKSGIQIKIKGNNENFKNYIWSSTLRPIAKRENKK